VRQAAREFDFAKDTLRRRLGECHEEPGADGCYSTKQLTSALYGDLYGARLRTQNEQAEKLRIENEISRAEVLSRGELEKTFSAIADAMVSRIMAADIPRRVKEDLLKELASIPLILEEVAHGQTRLRRNGKAKRDGAEDGSES
jgi:phage terminase Nu1 subunit (DNA packaging protein)